MVKHKSSLPVLLIGATGVVGKWGAKHLRRFQPDLPIVVGGRNLSKSKAVADEIGNATAIAVDLNRLDLGLTEENQFSAVGIFFRDRTFNAQKFAQNRSIPFVTISGSVPVIGEDIATYIHGAQSSPVIIASHWMAGIPSTLAIHYAQDFHSIDHMEIVANFDPNDEYGDGGADENQYLFPNDSNPLVIKDSVWTWERDENNITHSNIQVDGMNKESTAHSFADVLSIGASTKTKSFRFAVSMSESFGSKYGKRASHNITIEVQGKNFEGIPSTLSREIISSNGQATMVGLGAAIILEQVLGLVDGNTAKAGLYFPENIVDAKHLEMRLSQIDVQIRDLAI
ncbi:hypothetical protein SAMN04487970_10111 [Paenibacillus tianmuensis]|uniref:Saccharopine dehydrogenase n=1 Tax=Paenibacillus tianmuensis TaxID=624147 RepID=A0A1G4R1B7_9BACL|nr:hypothetical protein [Paenibacillus tianmuensis]SCW50498.1 hypothetical protein SAMN04487970_10111 [Paenibacillus tianmuensis]